MKNQIILILITKKSSPDTEIPHLDIPDVEEHPQINTNKQIDKDDKTISFFCC